MKRKESPRKRAKRGKQRRHRRPGKPWFTWERGCENPNSIRYRLIQRASEDREPVELVVTVQRHPFQPKTIAMALRGIRKGLAAARGLHYSAAFPSVESGKEGK